jgi:transposase
MEQMQKENVRKRFTREKLIERVAQIKPCIIGIETCMGAHYWAKVFGQLGHTVKIMAPQFVKPYVMANKNDKNDAKGIAEAVTRPDMKFVSAKNIEQQDILLLHVTSSKRICSKTKNSTSKNGREISAWLGLVPRQYSSGNNIGSLSK